MSAANSARARVPTPAALADVTRSPIPHHQWPNTPLAWLLFAPMLAAPLPARAGQSVQALSVTVTVIPSMRFTVLQQAATLTITEADIARGYVGIPAGSVIDVRENSRDGFGLSFNVRVGLFDSVEITGLGSPVVLGNDGGTVIQRGGGHRHETLALGYRFHLTSGVRPGDYAWPLALSVQTIDDSR